MNKETEWNRWDAIGSMARNSLRLFKMIWLEHKWMVLALSAVFLINSVAPFVASGVWGLLLNKLTSLTGGVMDKKLWLLLILLLVSRAIIPIMQNLQGYVSWIFRYWLDEKLEMTLLRKRGELDVSVHEDPKQNDLIIRVNENGVWRIHNFIDRQFYIVQNITEVVLASVIILIFKWWVFLIIAVGTIPELISEVRYGRTVWGIDFAKAEVKRRFWDLRGHFLHLNSLIELKLFQNIEYLVNSLQDLFRDFRGETRVNELTRFKARTLSVVMSQLVYAFATVWFIVAVVRGQMLIGSLVFVLASISDLRNALSGLFRNLAGQYQDSLFVTDVFLFLDLKPSIKLKDKPAVLTPTRTPKIVFENVSFVYPGSARKILDNISLSIEPGEKIALVGINGSGKTTLVKLLCRFYDPTEGRILVDSVDLREVDIESWYAHIGALFQNYANYHFLVKDSISVGRTNKTQNMEKVKHAAHASEAELFIGEWELGYEQMLGKNFTDGVEPSTGQWQKLALARAFYRDASILILDEPTSSIDTEAEAKIFEKLEALPDDHSVILISHRFSTVRHANKIVVIENGTISEQGNHRELLKLNGTYSRLFKLQAKGYE